MALNKQNVIKSVVFTLTWGQLINCGAIHTRK